MARIFLVVAVLLVLAVAFSSAQVNFLPIPSPTCPVRAMPDGSLYFFEAPNKTTLSQCREYETNSCCTESYAQSIAANADLLSRDLHSQLRGLSADCEMDFHKITCSPCAPDSAVYYDYIWRTWFDLRICRSFCNKMYESCKSAVYLATNKTVGEEFANGDYFCNEMFIDTELFVNVIPDTDRSCFDPLTRDCTTEDIDFHYTDCVNNRTDLIFNWRPGTVCSGGVSLPANVGGLQCPITCDAGSYLPLGQTSCHDCPAGYYSLGGGHRWERWDSWPSRYAGFATYCEDATGQRLNGTNNGVNCTGWKLEGAYIDSNIEGQADTTSVLEVRVGLRHNGTVSFVARVDAEAYDQFLFSVDNGIEYLIENQYEEKLYMFNVTRGYHVLRWKYAKDYSIDAGADSAAIYSITITNMAEHNDYCEPCAPGTFAAWTGSTQCTQCPMNYISAELGASDCTACNSSTYAFPGDKECATRPPCTTEDMQVFHTECSPNHDRSEYWTWMEPKICVETTVSLPLRRDNVECAPCNAGHFRSGQDCLPCPDGQYSDQGNNATCNICPPGSEAPRSLDLDIWDQWPNLNVVNECTGVCGTTGWRLREDFIDAGTDHGDHVDVALTFSVEIVANPHGQLNFDFELFCQDWCYLEVYDNNRYLDSFWNTAAEADTSYRAEGPYNLEIGKHNITFLFGKWFSRRNNDTVRVHKILVEGVKEGGATECIPCDAGSFSVNSAYECQLCQPGYFSPKNSTSCQKCPVNTYAPAAGTPECRPCGHNTVTAQGSTQCDFGQCTYTPSGSGDTYNLNPLARSDKLWGPLYETGTLNPIYFNPCPRTVANNTCKDRLHAPLNTSLCQHSSVLGYATDLGHVMGYYNLGSNDSSAKGLIVEYTEGAAGCGNWWLSQPAVPRKTNVTFICDPSVGQGRLELDDPFKTDSRYPNVCSYALEWRSVFACPVCRADHYEALPGPCVDGKQTVTYKWKANPKNCHSGLPLPANVVANCSTTTVCGPGTYLTGADVCVGCPAGSYSLGNGEAFDNFNSTVDFNVKCEAPSCTSWSTTAGDLVSGSGISFVEIVRNFKSGQGSNVEFEYKVVGHNSRFVFYIDNEIAFEDKTYTLGYAVHRHDISVGSHRLRWQFEQGTGSHIETMRIRRIDIRGTLPAVSQCTLCDPGEVNDDDRAGCHPCTVNHYVLLGKCEPCPANTFRLPGPDLACLPRVACAPSDFVSVIPNIERLRCDESKAPVSSYTISYEPLVPQICTGSAPAPTNSTACIPCPFGRTLQNGVCAPCPTHTYLKNGKCVAVDSGYAAIPELAYFMSGDVRSDLPSGFTSECRGEDCSTLRWRLNAAGAIESGVHSGEVDNVLTLTLDFVNDPLAVTRPRIDFTALLDLHRVKRGVDLAHVDAELEFFIDGEEVPLALTNSVPLSKSVLIKIGGPSTHTFKWIFAQGLTTEMVKATVSNIRVFGVKNGGATEEVECPVGHFVNPTNGVCLPCDPGYYSNAPRASQCAPCAVGSVSERGSSQCQQCTMGMLPFLNSQCVPSCQFEVGEHTYNLTGLHSTVETTGTFTISPCMPLSAPSTCPDCRPALVFGRDGGNSYSFGNTIAFKELGYLESSPSPRTFVLNISGSDRVPPFCISASASINFICDLEAGRGHPIFTEGSIDSCHPSFDWRSALACRVCSKDELVEERSACTGGSREVLYQPKSTCVLGFNYSKSKSEKCSAVEVDETIGGGVALGILVVVVVLAVIAGVFWKRKRDVETKYERLRGEVPMDDMDDTRVDLDTDT